MQMQANLSDFFRTKIEVHMNSRRIFFLCSSADNQRDNIPGPIKMQLSAFDVSGEYMNQNYGRTHVHVIVN